MGSCVTVTLVSPAKDVAVPPREMAVVPIVTELLVRELLPMFVRVLVEPLIDLLVSVSVVALPTNVSVEVGSVKVPVFRINEIVGVTSVKPEMLEAVPPRLTLVDPIVMELLVREPLLMLVSVLVAPLIVTPVRVVRVAPRETEVEPMVMALLTRLEFATLLKELSDALKVTPVSVPPEMLTLLAF